MELLLKNGCRVAVVDLNEYPYSPVNPDKCIFICADVCSENQVQAAIDGIIKKFERLDVVINCAGIMLIKPIYDRDSAQVHPLDLFQTVINVNLCGTFNVCRLAVAAMLYKDDQFVDGNSQRGIIINTSSVAGLDGLTKTLAYSASKAAVAGMTFPMARELGKFGIRVMSIAPGPFRTPLVGDPGEMKSLIGSITFPKRPGNPDEFADIVLTIIKNQYLNGEVIRLDAGLRGYN